MRRSLSDHLPYRSARCSAIPTISFIRKTPLILRGSSPKPMPCYAQTSDEPSIAYAIYLYSPSVALEVPCRITWLTMILRQGYFLCSRGRDISALSVTLLLGEIVPFRFRSFQSFSFQRQHCQWILSIQGVGQSIRESPSCCAMQCSAIVRLAAMRRYSEIPAC